MRTGAKTLRPRAVFTRTSTSESQLVNALNKMNTKFNLSDILASEANVILQVSSDDLKMFAQDILIGAKSVAMLEAETAASGDQLLTIDEASNFKASRCVKDDALPMGSERCPQEAGDRRQTPVS